MRFLLHWLIWLSPSSTLFKAGQHARREQCLRQLPLLQRPDLAGGPLFRSVHLRLRALRNAKLLSLGQARVCVGVRCGYIRARIAAHNMYRFRRSIFLAAGHVHVRGRAAATRRLASTAAHAWSWSAASA
eukprot:scaffold26962_cov114-Isochrysis_galbana.AAC.11